MKNIKKIVILLLISNKLFANNVFQIYYTNGVAVSEDDIELSVSLIDEMLNVETKPLYNPTGNSEDNIIKNNAIQDVLEVVEQKQAENKNYKKDISYIVANFSGKSTYKDLAKKHLSLLEQDISKYKIFLSHSQGNLVRNHFCRYIKTIKPNLYTNSFQYSIATPANKVECSLKNKTDNSLYSTFERDLVINLLRNKIINKIVDIDTPLIANIDDKIFLDYISNALIIGNLIYNGKRHTLKHHLESKVFINKFWNDIKNNIPKKFNLKDKVIAEYKYEDNLNLEYKNPKLTVLLKELQKCQDNKIGCTLELYKDKIFFGSNNTAMNACLMLSITRPNKDNDDSCNKLGKLDKSPKEIKRELFYQLENSSTNPLIKYGNKTTKTLIKEIKQDLQNTFSAKELINFTNSLVNTVSFRNKVISEKDVLNLILLNHQREFLAQNVLSTYYPKALTEYDFFIEEFFKDSYMAADSLKRIKYYCSDKTNLECINHYNNARSIASEDNHD